MARVAKRGGKQQKKVEEALPKVAKCIRDHLSIDPEKKNAFTVGKANARRTKPGLWADITKADRLRLANSAIRRLTYQDKREPDFTKIPSAKTAGEFSMCSLLLPPDYKNPGTLCIYRYRQCRMRCQSPCVYL